MERSGETRLSQGSKRNTPAQWEDNLHEDTTYSAKFRGTLPEGRTSNIKAEKTEELPECPMLVGINTSMTTQAVLEVGRGEI